jgi:hypothetical protein
LTWIECPFLSVALLRRLKTGFQLLTGTKRFFINTKIPRPLTTVKPRLKVVLHDSRGGGREARTRVRAPGRMRARCWAPSSCRRPVSGAASGASVARRSTQLVATPSQARISRAAAPGSAATVQSTPARHVLRRTCVCLHSCVPCAVRQHDLAQAWFSALSQHGAWSPVRARGEATAVVRHP